MTAPEHVIAEALEQVDIGFEVFSLGKDSKKPVTEHGFKNATRDPEWVRKQLEAKSAGNYGMAWPEGSPTPVVMFDLDDGAQGPGSGPDWKQRVQALIGKMGDLPATKITMTPSGGSHAFFWWPPDVPIPTGDELFGFTVRWPGRGYAVGPGSSIGGKVYTSNRTSIAPLPRAWVDAAVEQHAPRKKLITVHGDGYQLPDYVPPGRRYSTVRDYSASKWAQGLKVAEIWKLVVSEVAPRFGQPKPEVELRRDFDRAMAHIEERLGPQPRKGLDPLDAVAAVSPITVTPLSEYAVEAVTWLWHRWLPVGSITLLDGNPGEGKSTIVADLIARLTRGDVWPDGSPVGHPGVVLYITKEDDPRTQVRPRIEVCGGDPTKVLFVENDLLFPRDTGRFREMLHETRPRLVLIDPLMSYLEGKVRAISDNEVRSALMTPLADVARTYACSLLVIRHFNKGTGQSALNRGAGSLGGLAGSARLVMSLTTHPGDETARVFGVIKSNYEAKPRALKVAIEAAPVDGFQMTVSRATWLGESDVSIVDAMEQTAMQHEDIREAMDDLADILDPKRNVEPVPKKKVVDLMRARGHNAQSVEKARKNLGVVIRNLPTVPRTTAWMLPTVVVKVGETTSATSREEAE